MPVSNDDGPLSDLPTLAALEDQLVTDPIVKDHIFSHYEIGDEFLLGDISKDTGMSDDEAVNGLLNAWWWDADTGNPLLMVELVGEFPDRFRFVKAPHDWLPDDEDD